MNEQIIKFTNVNCDGCETNIIVFVRIYGNDITVDIIDRVKNAISNYKNENKGKWDANGCLEAAQEQLEADGYEVHFINPSLEIYF